MRDPEGARFLFRMAKASRKYHAGLAAITQDAEDVLSTDLGRAVIANSATQILLRQSPQAITKVAAEFRLSRRGTSPAPVGGQGDRAPGRRPLRASLLRSPGVTGRKRLVHVLPGRDRPPASPPAARRSRRPAAARRRR